MSLAGWLASRSGLLAPGLAILLAVALGGPALRLLGDNAFIGLALAAGGLAALVTTRSKEVPDDRDSLLLIFGIAIVLRAVVLFQPPLLSNDVYRYVWDGRVTAAGINPYRYVPADPALAGLRDAVIYPQVDRAGYAHTIYPPVAQAFFLLVTRLSEGALAMRFALVLCEVVTLAATLGLLRRLGRSRVRIVAYAWHPLPVWEIAGNGHIDSLMMALMMGGLYLAIARGRHLAGAATVALGALAKPFALLALPPLWRPWNLAMVTVVAGIVAAAYGPFLSVGSGVIGFLGDGYLSEQRISSGEGFWMLRVWRSLARTHPGDTTFYLLLAAVLVGGLALRAGFRRDRDPATVLGDAGRLLLVFLVLLSPDFPWYFLPVVPFLALTGGPAAWMLTAASFLLYDVVPDDPQVPFVVRSFAFNALVLGAGLYGWYRRRGKSV